MKRALQLHRDQRGLVGKMMIVWLLLVAVLAVGAIDAGSIALTKFKLSSVAVEAASDGAVAYRNGSGAEAARACRSGTVTAMQPDLRMGRNFCEVDPSTGQVTITLRTTAGTILARSLGLHEALHDRRPNGDQRPVRRVASSREPARTRPGPGSACGRG